MAVASLTLEQLRSAGLAAVDPEIARLLEAELERQRGDIELIASENFTWRATLEGVGSVPTNKYSEGYPGRRYYGGCEVVDEIEQLAIDRAKSLFGAEHANVQPHAGAQTNMAVYFACLEPGDTILSLELSHGGHLTHGLKVNFSGRLYDIVHYGVSRETYVVDYDEVLALAREHRPKLVKMFRTYTDTTFKKAEKLEILSISLDKEKDKWLDAVRQDTLFWMHHVNDMRGWETAAVDSYQVSSIPSSFLVDQNGIIIGKNLKPRDLEKLLANLANSSCCQFVAYLCMAFLLRKGNN